MVDFFVDGYFELSFAVVPSFFVVARLVVATISTISGISVPVICVVEVLVVLSGAAVVSPSL